MSDQNKGSKAPSKSAPSQRPSTDRLSLEPDLLRALAQAVTNPMPPEAPKTIPVDSLFKTVSVMAGQTLCERGPIDAMYCILEGTIIEEKLNDDGTYSRVRELVVGHLAGVEFLTRDRFSWTRYVVAEKGEGVKAYVINDEALKCSDPEIAIKRRNVLVEALARHAIDLTVKQHRLSSTHQQELGDCYEVLAAETTAKQALEADLETERLLRHAAEAKLAKAQGTALGLSYLLRDLQEELREESVFRCEAEMERDRLRFLYECTNTNFGELEEENIRLLGALRGARFALALLKADTEAIKNKETENTRLARIEQGVEQIRVELRKQGELKQRDSGAHALVVGLFNQCLTRMLEQIPTQRLPLAFQGLFEQLMQVDDEGLRKLGIDGMNSLFSQSGPPPNEAPS